MIHVIATIEVKEGRRDAFLREFHLLAPQVQAEPGCLEYGPAVDVATDIPTQAPIRADVVLVIEQWSDLAALENHLRTPHMVAFRERIKDLVKSLSLRILQPA